MVFVAVALQAFCLPVPGTTALVAAAVYAATDHGLPIAGVIAAGVIGVLIGSVAAFVVGRWGGERVLLRLGGRLRQRPERVQQLREVFAAQGVVWVFVGRWITGLRNVAGLLAGATGMPMRRFLPVTAAAALAWSLLSALEYYYFGHALLGAGTPVRVVLACAGIAWLVVSLGFLRRRALQHLGATAATPEPD